MARKPDPRTRNPERKQKRQKRRDGRRKAKDEAEKGEGGEKKIKEGKGGKERERGKKRITKRNERKRGVSQRDEGGKIREIQKGRQRKKEKACTTRPSRKPSPRNIKKESLVKEKRGGRNEKGDGGRRAGRRWSTLASQAGGAPRRKAHLC